MNKLIFNACIALSIFPSLSFGHSDQQQNTDSYIDASAALIYRSKSNAAEDEAYLIPGALLGGEVYAYEKGLHLDEVQLAGAYTFNSDYQAGATLGSHLHDGHHETELESAWLNWNIMDFTVKAGKMTTATTESASWHASRSLLTEASLSSDIFFGRHFNDTGIRLELNRQSWRWGVEAWNGDSWPAQSNEGAFDTYLKWFPEWRQLKAELGLWVFYADVENRKDERYTSGHSHGGTDIASTVSEYQFNGDNELGGAYINLHYPLYSSTLFTELEWLRSESDGQLSNTNQSAEYQNQYEGIRTLMGIRHQRHTLFFQYEKITLENHFFGDVSANFINGINLNNSSFEPEKVTLGWHWQLHDSLKLKAEAVHEENQNSDDKNKRYNIGLVWNKLLY